jgi:hypothetical protein
MSESSQVILTFDGNPSEADLAALGKLSGIGAISQDGNVVTLGFTEEADAEAVLLLLGTERDGALN